MDVSSVALITKEVMPNTAAIEHVENKAAEKIRLEQRQSAALKSVSIPALEKMIEAVNKALSGENVEVALSIRKDHVIVITIIDSETNKVIKEIPPRKILDMISMLEEIVGLVIDESR
jgi:flagellar protein FlaG